MTEQAMTKSLDIQELEIVLQANNLNPASFRPECVQYMDIFPSDWELARQPVYRQDLVQLVFKSSISLMIQPNRISLSELALGNPLDELQIATLASKCVEKLSNIDYQALGINSTGLLSFPEDKKAAAQFLRSYLLAPRTWQNSEAELIKASLKLSYQLDREILTLTIQEGVVSMPENETISALLVNTNGHHVLTGESQSEHLADLKSLLEQWQTKVADYTSLVNHRLLQEPAFAPGY